MTHTTHTEPPTMQALLDANAQVTHSLATWNFLDHCLTIAKANLDNLPTGCADYSRCAGLPEYRLPGISELHTASGAPGIADGFIGLRPDAA